MMAAAYRQQTSLSSLLAGMLTLPDGAEREVSGIALDSRLVEPGSVFMACKGAKHDGRAYIGEAIDRGACAVLVEADEDWQDQGGHEVPVLVLDGLPRKVHELAARYYGMPARSLRMVGITGTNGKTSCCQLAAELFTRLGYRCGVIGTLGHGLSGQALEKLAGGPGTTPDAVQLQKILAGFVESEADTVVMEVSSHGIHQHRVNVNDYDYAMFTNLSRDHLDYHRSLEAYGRVKRRLFRGERLKAAILNLDDSQSAGTRTVLDDDLPCYTWSVHNAAADIRARRVDFTAAGIAMDVVTPWGEFAVRSPLLGTFNASNLLGVLGMVLACESPRASFSAAAVVEALCRLGPVPGRMQLVGRFPVTVVVDYAHTPDALEKALSAVSEHCTGAVCCVFGCGGDRDKGKRPHMGAVADRLADQVILTDDNPRSEDSRAIIRSILAGIDRRDQVEVIPDRAAAIRAAIMQAEPGDIVLVAGKGHEEHQEVAGRRIPFNDAAVAEDVLRFRFGASPADDAEERGQE